MAIKKKPKKKASSPKATKKKKKGRPEKIAPTFKVQALPFRSSGVHALYQVIETKGEKEIKHTVYFDKQGIYCVDHDDAYLRDPRCPAVAIATKEHNRTTKR